ncbi:hypothetical protein AB1Y20_002773 [Prymnesium parvum]|uniref:Uncharacterized protein n=1 Tax=Prymnesium parvum TaxID=97485 RepID=A0AB34JCL0_PRYPA
MVGRSGPRQQAAKGTLTGTTPPQRGQRSVRCSLLFDPSLPTFAVEMWTVWRPSSPSTTKGSTPARANAERWYVHCPAACMGARRRARFSDVFVVRRSPHHRLGDHPHLAEASAFGRRRLFRNVTWACLMISGVNGSNRRTDNSIGSMHGSGLHLNRDGLVTQYSQIGKLPR